MNIRFKILLQLAVIVLLGTVIYPTGVFALTFTPDRFVTEVYPGVPLTEELTLLNETGETISVLLEPVGLDASMAAEGRAIFLLNTAGSASVSWIAVSPSQLVLEPGEARSVDITFTAPSASEGSLLAGIATTFRPVRSDESGDVAIVNVTGPLIFAEVNTESVVRDGFIESLTTTGGSSWFAHLPVTFEASFANNGTVHLQPSVILEVHDLFGRLTERVDLNEDQHIVLPHTSRDIKIHWDANLSEERTSGISRELVSPLVGPFKATVTMNYDGSASDSAHMTVWFFPWRLSLLMGIILVGIVSARRRLRRV